jgi:membrane protein
MATLGDVRPVLKSYGSWAFLKRLYQQCSEDDIFVWASALAYSWLFSIFPFLILLLSLVPYFPQKAKDTAYDTVSKLITQMLGKEAPTVNDNLTGIMTHQRTGWLGIGLVVTIWVASGGMAMTMSALDRCYDIKETRPWYKQRAIAIAMTLGVTIGMLLMIILLPIGTAVETWLKSTGGISFPLEVAFDAARYFLSLLFALFVLAIIYYFGPNIRQRFRLISPGAIFSAVVWILLDVIFRFYIDKFARYDQTYGSVGGAAILLLFFYIDGLVLLVGAEINSEIDFESLGVPSGSKDFTGQRLAKITGLPEIAKEL